MSVASILLIKLIVKPSLESKIKNVVGIFLVTFFKKFFDYKNNNYMDFLLASIQISYLFFIIISLLGTSSNKNLFFPVGGYTVKSGV